MKKRKASRESKSKGAQERNTVKLFINSWTNPQTGHPGILSYSVYHRLEELNRQMSDHCPDSDLSLGGTHGTHPNCSAKAFENQTETRTTAQTVRVETCSLNLTRLAAG